MSSHTHGEMNVAEQKKTFAGFVKAMIWLSAVVAASLIFLAIVGI